MVWTSSGNAVDIEVGAGMGLKAASCIIHNLCCYCCRGRNFYNQVKGKDIKDDMSLCMLVKGGSNRRGAALAK